MSRHSTTDANLHPGFSPALAAEFGVPADCGCRARNVKLVDVRLILAEVATLRDTIAAMERKPFSRRRFNLATLEAGEAARSRGVYDLIAALPDCICR